MTAVPSSGRGFATFVIGASNQLAVAAARAMGELAIPPFNPLYLTGPAGMGKTHLLHAIGLLRLETDPGAAVRYTSWEEVAEGWSAAAGLGRGGDFLRSFFETGLLLVDDLQRLPERTAGRGEILQMLESRLAARRSTVLAGTRSPAHLFTPDDPASRLLGQGLVAEFGAPDVEMRRALVEQYAEAGGARFGPEVILAVAEIPFATIRDLVGAVVRLTGMAGGEAILEPAQARALVTGELDERLLEGVPGDPVLSAAVEFVERGTIGRRESLTGGDEFGSFLSDVVEGVSQQVDQWKARIAEEILFWQGEGFHTARLQALLDQDLSAPPDLMLAAFRADALALRRLAEAAAGIAPDLAAHEAFRDPDQRALAAQLVEEARSRDLVESRTAPHLLLKDLVEGPSNRSVLYAVRAAASAPGRSANPLILIGESGTGKTHLLHGLGNALADEDIRGVMVIGAAVLAPQVEEAVRAGRLTEWQQRFQWAGALLLDDVHLLANHPAAQETFCLVFDRMLEAGRQVAVTSAVPLSELGGCSVQLLTRLGAGLIAEVPRPDREVRHGVIRKLLPSAATTADPGLAGYLADRPADSVRAVQAMVQTVLHAAAAAATAPTIALAREALEARPSRPATRPGRLPGVIGPTLGAMQLREKLIVGWPSPGDHLSEELD
jgi:chromosomal replication initiation ATPase DnaA